MTDVSEWRDPPQMDTGAPMPGVYCNDANLLLAYIVRSGPASAYEEFAIVRFSGVLQHTFGYPNDEALGGHPYYGLGLQFYAFNEIARSPYLDELGKRNARVFAGSESLYEGLTHWIVTFHDETLEVVGRSAQFVGCVEAKNANAAIRWYLDREPALDGAARRSFVDDD